MQDSLLLIGYFGYGNLGDEETLRIFTEELKERKIRYLTVVGGRAKTRGETAKDAQAEPTVGRRDLPALKKAVAHCRGIVLVGGNLLQSESSSRSLFYYTLLLRYALRQGKPVSLFAGGIGGFRLGKEKKSIEKLITRFSFLGFRTFSDVARIKGKNSEKCKVCFTPDLCFSLEERVEQKENLLLLIPRGGAADDPDFRLLIREAKRAAWRVAVAVFFPKEDGKALTRLSKEYGTDLFFPTDYEEFARCGAAARLAVSERFHGGVFSLLCHTPCFLLSASEKSRALCDTVAALVPEDPPLRQFTGYAGLRKSFGDGFFSRAEDPDAKAKKETGEDLSGFSSLLSYLRKTVRRAFDDFAKNPSGR